jgi:hypothetical protein
MQDDSKFDEFDRLRLAEQLLGLVAVLIPPRDQAVEEDSAFAAFLAEHDELAELATIDVDAVEAEEEIDMSDMQWTLVDWLDRLPLRRFGPIGRAKLKLVNWLDNWFDDRRRAGIAQ